MRVLVAAPYAVMHATFETDLEIIQDHLDAGDHVTLLGCNADLSFCQPNPPHDLGICIHCISRRGAGVRALSHPVEVKSLVRFTQADHDEIAGLPKTFDGIDDLARLRLENYDLGWGVVSSIVSATFEPHPDLGSPPMADLVRRAVASAVAVYRSMQRHLDEERPDRVYVFNGRFSNTRAVLRAAQSRGIDCYMQERASSFRHYVLVKNKLSHDPDFYQEMIRDLWNAGDPEERAIMGASFFIESAQGVNHAWDSFVAQQKSDALPEGFDPTKNNVAVYTSSDFEFAAIRDVMINPLYKDQYDGLARVIASARAVPDLRLWIRMHPNAQLMSASALATMMAMAGGNAAVVPPTSPVSTYALMRAATRVLTFGSTTGVEATYWRKPSILGNRSYYDTLGATYNPSSHEELIALLRRPGLPPKDRGAALMYGYFARVYGKRFRHFQPTGLGGGPFRGITIRPSPAARIAARAATPFSRNAGKVHLQLLARRFGS